MTTSPSSANQAVAEEIAVLMARRGRMTNKELAEATGIEKSTLGRKLKGAPFKVDELEAIAAYFDVPITELFGRPTPAPGDTQRYGLSGADISADALVAA